MITILLADDRIVVRQDCDSDRPPRSKVISEASDGRKPCNWCRVKTGRSRPGFDDAWLERSGDHPPGMASDQS